MTKGWFTPGELVGLPGLPGTERGINKADDRGKLERRKYRKERGWEYALTELPSEAQASLLKHESVTASATMYKSPAIREPFIYDADQLAEVYDHKTDRAKATAGKKLTLFLNFERYLAVGYSQDAALKTAAEGHASPGTGCGTSTTESRGARSWHCCAKGRRPWTD